MIYEENNTIKIRKVIIIVLEAMISSLLFCSDCKHIKFAMIFIMILCFYIITQKKYKYKRNPSEYIPVVLFSCFLVLGESFRAFNSLEHIIGGKLGILLTGVKILGWFFILNNFLYMLKPVCRNLYRTEMRINNKRFISINNFVMIKHSFLMPFIIMMVCWFPYLIIKYPGAIGADTCVQFEMFYGLRDFTTHHPPLHTLIIGNIVDLFAKIGGGSFGVFVCTLLQYIFMAGTFAFCLSKMKDINVKSRYRWIVLVIFSIIPIYPSYATTIIKDAVYVCCFMLFFWNLICIVKQNRMKVNTLIGLSVFALLMSLFRNNGVYVVIAVWIVTTIVKIKKNIFEGVRVCSALLLPIIVVIIFNNSIVPKLGIKKGSPAEMLSIPFQQTARLVRDYPGDISEEDKANIDVVLDFDTLAERYNPNLSDPVKSVFSKKYYKDSEIVDKLPAYFKAWSHGLTKHPIVYVQATMNTCYAAFYPCVKNTNYYIEDERNNHFETITGQNEQFAGIRYWLGQLCYKVDAYFDIIDNPAIYIWLLIILLFDAIRKKQYTNIVILLPNLMHILIIIAGPCVITHPRYIFPIMWSMFLYMAYYLSEWQKKA